MVTLSQSLCRSGLLCALVMGGAGLLEAAPAATVTSLTLSSSSVAFGSAVTLAASVTAGGNPVTAGSVVFMDGNRALGSAQVVISGITAGSATLKTSAFLPGSNVVTAIYSGAPNAAQPTAPSTSAPITLNVTGALLTSLALSVVGSPGLPGSYNLTGTLSGFGPSMLNGTVTFSETPGNHTLGTAPVGAATYSFEPAQSYNASTTGPAAVVADFDGDGFLDVAVGTSMFLGDPAHPGQFLLSSNPIPGYALAVGDFNSDGVPDLIIFAGVSSNVGIALGDPNHPGEFQTPTYFATTGFPLAAAVGDFNGDGVLDVVVVPTGTPASQVGSVNVLLGIPPIPANSCRRPHTSLSLERSPIVWQ